MVGPFSFYGRPRIHFGPGARSKLSGLAAGYGSKMLLVIGAHSLDHSPLWPEIERGILRQGLHHDVVTVAGEPSPELVDQAVARFRPAGIQVVAAIGGGSVLDAGKAISAMLPTGTPVMDFLEQVGKGLRYTGPKLPFLALPTTAGTGSEATKNAVLSRVGAHGFKKSLRHELLIPDAAVVDPELMLSCPPRLTAACGMDAFTQLLEAYVSTKANVMTDALAYSGLQQVVPNLVPVCTHKQRDVTARSAMAYGALVSGMVLANAGLGLIHGFASTLGGRIAIPHGQICGTLLAAVTRANLAKLKQQRQLRGPAALKYARTGRLFAPGKHLGLQEAWQVLDEHLQMWTETLRMPGLSAFGLTAGDVPRVVKETGHKNNPVTLEKGEMEQILYDRLRP